jgi:5-methyltetrahydropteroyltriglutamate--homocysteine methyltransferase
MQGSTDRIRTSHAGSLPRPAALIELNRDRLAGDGAVDEDRFQQHLTEAVDGVVGTQHDLGITTPGDGEFGKAMGQAINYGAWWSYSFQRLGGLELGQGSLFDMPSHRSSPGNIVLTSFADRRDRVAFSDAYGDPTSGVSAGSRPSVWPVCTGPLSYIGQEAVKADIANFKAALDARGIEEGFMTAIAPGSAARIANEHYATEEEFIFACADALREEYTAIIDAGLILQLDDPSIAENWDQINPEPTVDD